jgi:hypothetical protein
MNSTASQAPRPTAAPYVAFVLIALYISSPAPAANDAAPVNFRRDVAPILVEQCQGCHGPGKAKGKYRLDTLDRLTTPGESKSAPLEPGEPARSEIYRRIAARDDDDRMPQKADPLAATQISLICRWIEQGAKFDAPDPKAPLAGLVEDPGHAAPTASSASTPKLPEN